MARAIIMADGQQNRWLETTQGTPHEGITKQMISVFGEPMLHRTVRLLRENGIEDIWITSHNPLHEVPGTTRYEPENNTEEIDKLLACMPIWDKWHTNIFVYGDVFYTHEAMQKIARTPTEDFVFFGRFQASYFTGHPWGEIYCKKVVDLAHLEACSVFVRNWGLEGRGRGGGWELYRKMCGVDDARLNEHIPYYHFVSIDDFTDDMDTYQEYLEWERRLKDWIKTYG